MMLPVAALLAASSGTGTATAGVIHQASRVGVALSLFFGLCPCSSVILGDRTLEVVWHSVVWA